MLNLAEAIKDFHENGLSVVKGFATEAECDSMMAQMRDIVDNTDMKVHFQNHSFKKKFDLTIWNIGLLLDLFTEGPQKLYEIGLV